MGVPDNLSSCHDQLEEDGSVEEDQLLISFCSYEGDPSYPQCD